MKIENNATLKILRIRKQLLATILYLGCVLLVASSCLRETPQPIEISFDHQIEGDYNTSPIVVSLKNNTTGADFYEWTFEGGKPEKSLERDPGEVIFTTPGEHRITLRAWNLNIEERKEIIVRVDSVVNIGFDYQILINDFAPADVEIKNLSRGGSTYQWSFEQGEPSSSSSGDPGIVRFPEGRHKISLRVSNGSEWFDSEQFVDVKPPLASDFEMNPIVVDQDMEAPLTLAVENLSHNYLSILWSCTGGIIENSIAEQTTIRFENGGNYTVSLATDNLKEQQTVQKQLTVKPNSGIHTLEDLHFGISQAKNSIGCFFSVAARSVLKSNEITSAAIGSKVDIGFFALNSDFDHCYFFSPDKAAASAFAPIPGAIATQVNNLPLTNITANSFAAITRASDLNSFSFTTGDVNDHFALDQLPLFVFFKTADGRRGIIQIKSIVKNSADSYIVADIKIEKRQGE